MEEKLRARLAELEAEFRKGSAILQDQQAKVDDTKLRLEHIRGAISVLSELLACQE